jgi:SAM-dependent methyltransferase
MIKAKKMKIELYEQAESSPGLLLKEPPPTELTIPLLDAEQNQQILGKGITKLNGGFSDSAFADNKNKPIHRWTPWIAGFSADFVKDVIATYLPDRNNGNRLVLDPFCGVGTTLIEALRSGFNTVGFEINPFAALATETKCKSPDVSIEHLSYYIDQFEDYMKSSVKNPHLMSPPEHFHSRFPFFGELAQVKVLKALTFINNVQDKEIYNLFSLAFGSVMVSLSNYSYEPSLSSRPAAGKPVQKDAMVTETIVAKLQRMKMDIIIFRDELGKLPRRPIGRVIPDNFLNALHHLDLASVDLLITSPPYLNNYHYIRNTRPQLFWLGFVHKPSDLKWLELENFGKYWQTVRDMDNINLDFEHTILEELIYQLRDVNKARGTYGGNGWANYAASYFNDTNRFCRVISQLLKPGSRAVVVVGNSILQGIEIPVDNILSDLAARHGLVTENIHIVRRKRVGASIVSSSVRQGVKTTTQLYESAVIIRR